MRSHIYEVRFTELAARLGGILLIVALFAVGMRAGEKFRLLPDPRPTADVDQTILSYQLEESRTSSASILLLGDSSCLMNVDAKLLASEMGRSVLNLGTVSFLDLEQNAELLKRQAAVNRELGLIVVLMHPQALRRVGPEESMVRLWRNLLAGETPCRKGSWYDRLSCQFGWEAFRSRFWNRWVPTPLGGSFAKKYGFSEQLESHLQAHRGSLIDPAREKTSGPFELRLSPTLAPACEVFRRAVPPGVRVVAGVTPMPGESTAAVRSQSLEMLKNFGALLRADGVLEALPPVLPEDYFARPTHLRESPVADYTRQLARALGPHLP